MYQHGVSSDIPFNSAYDTRPMNNNNKNPTLYGILYCSQKKLCKSYSIRNTVWIVKISKIIMYL